VGFSQPITSAEGVDSADQFPNRLYKTGSMYPPAETAVLELEGKPTLQTEPTANGTRARVLGPQVPTSIGDLPVDGQSQLQLSDTELDGYAAAELRSAGRVRLRPADGYPVDTFGAPLFSGPSTATELRNFRFFAPLLVLTDAQGYSQFNFPDPFPNACWYVDAEPAGDFGYSFNWGVVSWTRTGARLRAGEPSNDAIIANTTLTLKLMAVGY
jgi:hypothetical protein